MTRAIAKHFIGIPPEGLMGDWVPDARIQPNDQVQSGLPCTPQTRDRPEKYSVWATGTSSARSVGSGCPPSGLQFTSRCSAGALRHEVDQLLGESLPVELAHPWHDVSPLVSTCRQEPSFESDYSPTGSKPRARRPLNTAWRRFGNGWKCMARTSRAILSTGCPWMKPGPPTSSTASSTVARTASFTIDFRARIPLLSSIAGVKPWFSFARIMSAKVILATVSAFVISPTTGASSSRRNLAAVMACSAAASASPT